MQIALPRTTKDKPEVHYGPSSATIVRKLQ